jgi:phosphotransferase system  glucose/maltose/N-acetylglucosamine-specific IIC component
MVEFNLDIPQLIGLLSGIILPLVVGFVTTRFTDARFKAIALAFLSVVINILTELGDTLADGTRYDLGTALVAGLGTFLVAVGIHFGLWKPVGATDKVQSIGVTPKV